MAEKERVDAYLDTVRRIEPDIAMIDNGFAAASIAISLKRIADTLEVMAMHQDKLPISDLVASALGLRRG